MLNASVYGIVMLNDILLSTVILIGTLLNGIALGVIMLNAIVYGVVTLNDIVLSVIMLSVVAPTVYRICTQGLKNVFFALPMLRQVPQLMNDLNDLTDQGILTEVEGSVQLTS